MDTLRDRCLPALAGLLLGFWLPDLQAASRTVPRPEAPFAIDSWDTEDGLPQNSVTAIAQGREGYLWLGTLNGLVRFDGIRFEVFDQANTPGLPSGRIFCLFEDRQRRLWIGTETEGVAVLQEGQIATSGIGQGAAERRLVSACEDQQGGVWFYMANGDLWRFWDGRYTPFLFEEARAGTCRRIIAEPAGPVWVGTDSGQYAIGPIPDSGSLELPVQEEVPAEKLDYLLAARDGGYWRLADGLVQKWHDRQLERDLGRYPWSIAPVSAVCEDRQGGLVVGTLGLGVYWLDAQGRSTWFSTNNGLSHNVVLSLHMDEEGCLWVGTDGGGLNRLKRQAFVVFDPSQGLEVQSVCEDAQGGVWIGFNGTGLLYVKENLISSFGRLQGLTSLYVRAVFVDRAQQVWAGTFGGGLLQFQGGRFRPAPGSEVLSREVSAIYQDGRGRLWVGTQGGLGCWDGRGWKVFTTKDGLSADAVRALASDPADGLWIGTVGGGLNRLHEGRFVTFRKDNSGLPGDSVTSLHRDDAGALWIGTDGRGLGRLQEGQWTCYTRRQGLASDSIGSMVEDGEGYVWICSNAGLMRADKKTLNAFARGEVTAIQCRTYGKQDGLPTRECSFGSQPGACRTREGKLWFPTIKGLVSINPDRLTPNRYEPPVIIESVRVGGEVLNTNRLRVRWPGPVTIPPGKPSLEIHYTSLNLAAAERARFRYVLEGHETGWIEAGNVRVAHYSKLPPGDYRFHVTACNEDGLWNRSGASLEVIVEPPFWRTWWFLGGASAGLLAAIVGLVHYFSTQRLQRQLEQMRQQEALEKERARIARDIHDQLGASLTQVSLLGELVEGDRHSPEEVEAHARQISQTARETTRALDEIVWTVNPSNDTLDGLITYVCKYAQDYLGVAGLRYRLDVPESLPGVPITPEVRHNVFLAAQGSRDQHRPPCASRVGLGALAAGARPIHAGDSG